MDEIRNESGEFPKGHTVLLDDIYKGLVTSNGTGPGKTATLTIVDCGEFSLDEYNAKVADEIMDDRWHCHGKGFEE